MVKKTTEFVKQKPETRYESAVRCSILKLRWATPAIPNTFTNWRHNTGESQHSKALLSNE